MRYGNKGFAMNELRRTLAANLGQILTPEMAVAIEQAAAFRPDLSINPADYPAERHVSVVFAVERLADIVPEMHALHEEHYAETELAIRGVPLAMDYDALLASERAGRLIQVTARCTTTGRLVGNVRLWLYQSIHTKVQCAKEDTFFLLKEFRLGWTALRMWRYAERVAIQRGAREIRTDSKVSNGVSVLNLRCGYTHVSNNFIKTIKD